MSGMLDIRWGREVLSNVQHAAHLPPSCEVLSDVQHAGHLPPSWGTLECLTKTHVEAICAAWQKGVGSIIATGECIARAQHDVGEGKFESDVLPQLPFDRRTAYYLKAIANHSVLSNVHNCAHLPPHVRTLADLAQVPQTKLIAAIKSGDVHPGMERKDVKLLLPPPKNKKAAAQRTGVTRVILTWPVGWPPQARSAQPREPGAPMPLPDSARAVGGRPAKTRCRSTTGLRAGNGMCR